MLLSSPFTLEGEEEEEGDGSKAVVAFFVVL
jgi:hypothetical protein